MTREQARSRTRTWMLVNYLAVLVAVILPLPAKAFGIVWLWIGVFIVLVAAISMSHDRAFGRTGLWALTHAKPNTLDERERQVAHEVLATSYKWITVAMLVAMYVIILSRDELLATWMNWIEPIAPVLAMALIYVAHTLPAAILGWSSLPEAEEFGDETQVA